MESHHESLRRLTWKKKAAGLSKTSSGPDLSTSSNSVIIKKSVSGNGEPVSGNSFECKDKELNTVPSLRKALKDVAWEDFSAQLLSLKKRLKEAEEEQYGVCKHAASLGAELNLLQQQAINGTMEKELADIKSQLEEDRERLDKQLHDMAVAVETLESSRQ